MRFCTTCQWLLRLLKVRRVRAQPKVRFICECFVPHFLGEHGCSESQVYIWWDFLSVSQTDHAMQKRQIECLPIFVAMSDAVCALRAGDEDFYAKEGAKVYDVATRSKVSHRQANSRPTETSRRHRATPAPSGPPAPHAPWALAKPRPLPSGPL